MAGKRVIDPTCCRTSSGAGSISGHVPILFPLRRLSAQDTSGPALHGGFSSRPRWNSQLVLEVSSKGTDYCDTAALS
jgi:hypothetical protein